MKSIKKDIRKLLEMIVDSAINDNCLLLVLLKTDNDLEKRKDIEYLDKVNIRDQWLVKLWNECTFEDEAYFWETVRFLRLNQFTCHQIVYNLKKEQPIPFITKQLPDDHFPEVMWEQKLLLEDSPNWERYCYRQTKHFWERIRKIDEMELNENNDNILKLKK